MQDLYADYRLEKSAIELFSLPQAKSFFGCLAYKLKVISDYVDTTEPYSRIILDEDVEKAKRLMNKNIINEIFQPHLDEVGKNYFSSLEIADCTLVDALACELTNVSPARLNSLRAKAR